MTAMLNTVIKLGVHGKYVTEFQLLETYRRKEYKEFDKYANADLLVIDEVGKDNLAEWEKKQLEELISQRYDNLLPTYFITNLNQKQFKERVGERVVDRLKDNNVQQFTMKGESLRGSKG
jgi:DNA replication protein DnaC